METKNSHVTRNFCHKTCGLSGLGRAQACLVMFACLIFPVRQAFAQRVLSLDSCRSMALRNNKQLNIAKFKQDVARDAHKAVKTKYLPHVSVVGGYQFTNRGVEQVGNSIGNAINDAFRTDTRNIFAASVMFTQPIFMGGGIVAADKIAGISEQLAANNVVNQRQNTVYDVDNAYWTVVSLKHKWKLANSYLELVKKLSSDVSKMIAEGVATRADGLKVDVKVNEAEMQFTQVDNGLSLAKMLLCQLCGLPADSGIVLEDEDKEDISSYVQVQPVDVESVFEKRAELKMLENTVEASRQATRLVRAAYLPQIALTGGYLVTNPSLFNGFERKFSGVWNIGVMVRMPIWNWFESTYKIRASKTATTIAELELDDAREKVELQVSQSSFKVAEAEKKLAMAKKSSELADENLRCANLGFKEGVMDVTDVMAAQTAWLQARSQKIDADIDVKLTQTNLKKVLGETLY